MNNRPVYIFLFLLGLLTWLGFVLINTIDHHFNPLPVYGEPDHYIETFELTNQMGDTFQSEAHQGQIWVVNYFFTSCPSVCPKMMKNMQEVHDIIRSDEEVLLLSFTVDPKRDQPERLYRYTNRFNVNHASWQLLTGAKKDLYRLARKSFLVSATDGGGEEHDFIHSENIVVIDANQKIRGIINGTADNADKQILDIISRLKIKS